MMKNIDIFGTCLSRELFNYTDKYTVKTYIMQQSIYTIDSNPFPIDLSKISTHDNYKFKNRMIYYDFNKLAFSKLSENPSEYLIIDFGDQSRDIVVLDDYENTKLLGTKDILNNLDSLKIKYHTENIEEYDTEKIYNYIKKFVNIILTIYNKNKIILNITQLQNEYYVAGEKKYTDDNIFVYKRRNFIKMLESFLIKQIPECKILHTKYDPILDINHRFGAPFPAHFEPIYYEYKMDILDALINGGDLNLIDELYKEKYNKSICLIRQKKFNSTKK